jgi:hypothetical protein
VNKKLYLITPPDYYYNQAFSVLLINTTPEEKEIIQDWLAKNDKEIVLYLYDNLDDISWLINVLKQVKTAYINVDNATDISYHYISYLVSHINITWYSEKIDFSVINKDRVRNINEYMARNWLD